MTIKRLKNLLAKASNLTYDDKISQKDYSRLKRCVTSLNKEFVSYESNIRDVIATEMRNKSECIERQDKILQQEKAERDALLKEMSIAASYLEKTLRVKQLVLAEELCRLETSYKQHRKHDGKMLSLYWCCVGLFFGGNTVLCAKHPIFIVPALVILVCCSIAFFIKRDMNKEAIYDYKKRNLRVKDAFNDCVDAHNNIKNVRDTKLSNRSISQFETYIDRANNAIRFADKLYTLVDKDEVAKIRIAANEEMLEDRFDKRLEQSLETRSNETSEEPSEVPSDVPTDVPSKGFNMKSYPF